MFSKKEETIILIVTGIIATLWIVTTLDVAERARSANKIQSADVVVVK